MKIANMKRKNTVQYIAIAGTISLGLSGNAVSAPGSLATSPLFLQTAVQPNIFFMIDDSGSMNAEVLLTSGAQTAHAGAPTSGTLDFTPNDADELRELCAGYNAMAYNPSRTYTPWQGLDDGNNSYQDQSLTAARTNPFFTGTTDLTNPTTNSNDIHFYFVWNDDGDGVYQAGECPTPTGFGTRFDSAECTATADCVPVNTLSAAQQTNYANWFSYYRKREYVMKRALSAVITRSSARAGLATINAQNDNSLTNNNNDILSLIADIDNITTPVNATAAANKLAMLRSLFRIDSRHGTPLRQGLERVGEYYEDGGSWSGSSPILPAASGGECQQNFSLLMSDGFWNGNAPNVGDADSDGTPSNPSYDGGVYADNQATTISNTLADVAMHYYERDLDTSMANKVRIIPGVDDNTAQHMVTYTIAFGVNGTLSAGPQPGDTTFTWPIPAANAAETMDDMRHAAFNGRGQFLSAGSPQNLIDTLSQQIADIQSRTGTAAAVSFNSSSLQTGSKFYQSIFDSTRWSGELDAIDINIDPVTGLPSVGGVAWSATTDIDGRTTARQFITYDGSSGVKISDNSSSNIDNAWNQLTTTQQNDLRTNGSGGQDNVATGKARLDYIRGARGCETNNAGPCGPYTDGGNTFNSQTLRDRDSALGDIVHSSPFFVGAPSTAYPDNIESVKYSTFAVAKAGRTGMLYVGANDGILHAFNESGTERFSYIPNSLFSSQANEGLHYLSDPTYTHRYYVDLSPIVQDAYINNGVSTAWRSILVGALRGGGKGLFAMDVTDPAALNSNAANKVLWEINPKDPAHATVYKDLGYTFSDIRIGKMNNGEWAAIFGNGYNNDPTGDGKAKLFIVYLDGSNVTSPIVIDTGIGNINNADCADAGSDCNGLSTPAIVDLNGDGTIDRVYAGDLHGNMWAFDVTGSSGWGVDYSGNPLFTACTPGSCNRQPITSKPSIARHLTEHSLSTEPNLMVFFGTGQYLTQGDNTSTVKHTFYGVWDSGSGSLTRSSLIGQQITETSVAGIGNIRTITDNAVDYTSKKGWLIDLPTSKERSVTNALALGHIVFFNTMIPSTNLCDDGGTGWLMAVDQLNGGAPSFVPVDINGDGVFDTLDEVGGSIAVGTESSGLPTESRFISNTRVTADSTGGINMDNVQPNPPPQPARMSWTGLEQ